MARRGRKPKFKFNFDVSETKEIVASILSVLLILFGCLALIAILVGFFSGANSSYLERIIIANFGWSTFFIAIFCIYAGLYVIGTLKFPFLNRKIMFGMSMLALGSVGVFGPMAGRVGRLVLEKTAVAITTPGAVFFYFVLCVLGVGFILDKGVAPFVHSFAWMINFVREKIFKMDLPEEEAEDSGELESGQQELLLKSGNDGDIVEGEFDGALLEGKSYDFTSKHVAGSSDDDDYDDDDSDDTDFQGKEYEIVKPPASPVGEEGDLFEDSDDEDDDEVEYEEVEEGASNKLPFTNKVWEYPSLDLLSNAPNAGPDAGNVQERAKAIEDTLTAFGIKANVVDINPGPAVTQYALSIAIGTKASKIQNLTTDLALRIKSPSGSVRIVAPIPGTSLVGIEVPNFTPSSVSLRSVLSSPEMKKAKSKLTVAVGVDVQGRPVIQDMARWPHALVAGATGAGKSVMLNALIASLLYRCSPAECRFIMIDPKMVEMVQYNGIPHLLTPVVTDVEQKAVSALAWAVSEMERRYKVFSAAGVRDIEGYNAKSGFQAEPYIVIFVDELADMMMVASSDVEKYIARLAQKSRATGIHLILATQRPSVNVLTGIIKANVPTRIAFRVTSNVDSRVIIDQSGAETLIGRGDMLFVPPTDAKALRIQGVWVSDGEISDLVDFLKESGVEPDYKEEIVQQKVASNFTGSADALGNIDEKMMEAIEIVVNEGKASASYLQRRLSLGYSRAARIVDELEEAGIIGQANGSKPRDVLVGSVQEAVSRITGGSVEDDE